MVLAFLEKAGSEETEAANPAAALTAFLAEKMGLDEVRLVSCRRLEGGAVQENWRLEIAKGANLEEESQALVLRTDARTSLPDSRPKAEEFALLEAAQDAGVLVPEPLWLCEDEGVIGAPFLITGEVAGTARGGAITARTPKDGEASALLEALAGELAKIHAVKDLPEALSFLEPAETPPAGAEVAQWRRELDALPGDWPALEWGLRWCANHLPQPPERRCLVHGDFRSGNYMVALESGRLTGILDWEFASWGDPMSDLGWFCAACWRFGRPDLEAGGIGSRSLFYQAYEDASGLRPDPAAVYFWEVLAHIRWAIIAVQQGLRFFEGGENTLDLALTGRLRPAQVQKLLLEMTAPALWSRTGGPIGEGRRSRPSKRNVMTDLEATRRMLESAAKLYREELRAALPTAQQDNARMFEEAISNVLADLARTENAKQRSEREDDSGLAGEIRRGKRDGDSSTHLALLEAVAQELSKPLSQP